MATLHHAELRQVKIDAGGNIIDSSPLKNHLNFSVEYRIVPDDDIPNSAGWPTLKEYLEAEASDSFEPKSITQALVITYNPV